MFEKLKDLNKLNSAKSRLLEEKLYELVSKEIESGQKRAGLWAKAIAISDGDEEKTKAEYIKLRVQSVKDENELNLEKKRQSYEKAQAEYEQEMLSEEEKRLNSVRENLQKLGFRILELHRGFKVYEPLGGTVEFNTLEQLESYAERIKKFF